MHRTGRSGPSGPWWPTSDPGSRSGAEVRIGTAAALHGGWPAVASSPGRRTVAHCVPTDVALVLGSAQPDTAVDVDRARGLGVSVVRRRSGGGAVLVGPGEVVWIDVWLPAGDLLWEDDVTRSFMWLGRTWARALTSLGVTGVGVHPGPFVDTSGFGRLVCFGAIGNGEVSLRADSDAPPAKVVGLSQRRTRLGAWFHTACLLSWAPFRLVDALALSDREREKAAEALATMAIGVDDVLAPGDRDRHRQVAPGTDRVAEVVAPGTDRVAEVDAPGTDRVAEVDAPGTDRVAEVVAAFVASLP